MLRVGCLLESFATVAGWVKLDNPFLCMDKDFLNLVERLIDERVDKKIRQHEIRVGWISGVIGVLFVFGIIHSIWLLRSSLP